ncbi:nucleotidyl transferase AbiEii/AbiGii toxin family protein [Candidatus Woesearchaeota archaeon]|nr:nucleotidyl transferase AbiEii/AbiGii toxin family protein [Candidatus Woesearchaeota archaeon]
MFPINIKLKKRAHKDIAYAQDLIVEELYDYLPEAVIHGGTAIWRCYQGNRFSEDIDVYIKKDKIRINKFFEHLEKKGFEIKKKRIKENSLYSVLKFNNVLVRFEALFKNIKNPILKEYENSEGIQINIFTLPPEDLIEEKLSAYQKRKKIRDLYDIFFLLRYIKEDKSINKDLKNFIKNFTPPEDEQNLKAIIISGLIPNSKNMLDYIRRWAK